MPQITVTSCQEADRQIVAPLVHHGGTHPSRLFEDYQEALSALELARERLKDMAPNQRDYYPLDPSHWEGAVREHRARNIALDRIITEVDALLHYAHEADEAEAKRRDESARVRAEARAENPDIAFYGAGDPRNRWG